ncbi:single-stranded DNA-binding protein [Kitasatospora camelliae]|uniref:Single-stranded DNA-binding protein n=1 Tax=Kitasatospora camelliae TaxID=3156397 RepID=A0AAU8K405_9ACTN
MANETVITLVGNVVDEPELRFTPSGAAVAKFRVASTARKFDKTTNAWVDEEPLFLTVNVWRQQAEQVAESLSKGMRVVVVGQLRQRSYETKEGEKRTVFEVEAEEVAASLKFATAKVTRANRQQGGGQQQSRGSQDPWASQGQPAQGSGGWGSPQSQGGGQEPPF